MAIMEMIPSRSIRCLIFISLLLWSFGRGSAAEGGRVLLDIVHRSHFSSPCDQRDSPHRYIGDPEECMHNGSRHNSSLIQGMLRRGLHREEALNRAVRDERSAFHMYRNRNLRGRGAASFEERVITSSVVPSGGEYMVQMQLGTPPQPVLLILDTGSGFSWVQCKACVQCFPQREPLFDSSASCSYSSLSCQQPQGQSSPSVCSSTAALNQSSEFQCNSRANICEYGVQYGGLNSSSFTTGIVSKDNLYFGLARRQQENGFGHGHDGYSSEVVAVEDFLFGCGVFNMDPNPVGNSGVLGLSRSKFSLPSQLVSQHQNLSRKFAYCFADLAHNSSAATSFITFGDSFSKNESKPKLGQFHLDHDLVYTPLVATPVPTQFYYVGLEGISVDGVLLPINFSAAFGLDPDGNGGTVLDSGTTLTLLNPLGHSALHAAFRSAATARGKLPPVSSCGSGAFNSTGHALDTCYRFDDGAGLRSRRTPFESSAVPSVAFHLAGDVKLVLPPDNVLFSFEEGSLYCLAFASTLIAEGINVIGNIQQQNLLIEYDLENSRIGFMNADCSARA